ncbi:MAG: carboxymuconolactone decarboxylase family protein [Sphingomonadaceae bacterium]
MTASGSEDFDIDARMAEVVGDAPRIEPLEPEAMDEDARQLVRDIRRSAGAPDVEQLPEYMRTVIRNPELFKHHMELGNYIYNGKLPPAERELAILRTGWLLRAPFEWGQHVNITRRMGFSDDKIERARQGSAAGGWTAHEEAILKAVEELLSNQMIADPTWAVLAESWDEAQLIEFPQMVGHYVAVAYVQNSIRARLEGAEEGLHAK